MYVCVFKRRHLRDSLAMVAAGCGCSSFPSPGVRSPFPFSHPTPRGKQETVDQVPSPSSPSPYQYYHYCSSHRLAATAAAAAKYFVFAKLAFSRTGFYRALAGVAREGDGVRRRRMGSSRRMYVYILISNMSYRYLVLVASPWTFLLLFFSVCRCS